MTSEGHQIHILTALTNHLPGLIGPSKFSPHLPITYKLSARLHRPPMTSEGHQVKILTALTKHFPGRGADTWLTGSSHFQTKGGGRDGLSNT